VQEFVGALLLDDEPGMHGLPECGVHPFALDEDQNEGFRGVAQTGELFQGVPGGGRQSPQLRGHKIDHVAGVVLGADAIEIPLPAWRGRVERYQSFARGRARSRSPCKALATSRSTSSGPSGASTISATLASAFLIVSSARKSG
jgi:hypothetical protein